MKHSQFVEMLTLSRYREFPGGEEDKNPPASAGDTDLKYAFNFIQFEVLSDFPVEFFLTSSLFLLLLLSRFSRVQLCATP